MQTKAPAWEKQLICAPYIKEQEVLYGHPLISHMPAHVQTFANTSRISTLTNRSRAALITRTMSHGTTRKIPPFDGTLETLTLGCAGNINMGNIDEIGDGNNITRRIRGGIGAKIRICKKCNAQF